MRKGLGMTTRFILLIAILMLAVNFTLGVMMMNQSKNVMKTMISQRMLDISNSAAAMLDGDALAKLTADDKDSEAYKSVSDTLTVFQDNIDLEYIYCIKPVGEKEFVFGIDPTPVDPGEFGSPIVYTEALYTASKGHSAVDEEPYTDAWGTFYSSYSPGFDSNGEVSGIVAVDFAADWYEAQIRNIIATILFSSILSLVVGTLIVVLVAYRMRRRVRVLNAELEGLSDEVDDLMKELAASSGAEYHPASQGAAEGGNKSDYDISSISERVRSTREDLMKYINHTHTREKIMITALTSDYLAVYYVDLHTDKGICYRAFNKLKERVGEGKIFSFSTVFGNYADKYVTEEYKDSFKDFIAPENILRSLEKDTILTCRYIVERDGVESYEMLHVTGIRNPEDPEGLNIHSIAVGVTDVDKETRETLERNRVLSEALAEAEESNKAKTAFLSNMSHEIRTPMNAIIGFDSIALSDPDISDNTRNILEKIGISAKHLLNIINDILDMSRIEAGHISIVKEEFCFDCLLEQVNTIISEQCANNGVKYSCNVIGETDAYYIGDDVKLRQILINMLGNSVKFTPEGGEVKLSIERCAKYEGNSTLRFTISDTGIGMDKDFLPRIFDAFSQEESSATDKHSSTGLGMAITKRIVELMNGDIEVESEKGVGTTFYVTITLRDSKCSPDDSERSAVNPQDIVALLVDPDDDNLEYTRLKLENIGIKSETATSCEKAAEMVRLRFARREPYNLVLVSDESDGEGCAETVSSIRSAQYGSYADILLISHSEEDAERIAQEAGADGYVTLPLSSSRLLSEIRRTFKAKAGSEANTARKAELSGKRILLAEDTEINAEIMVMILGSRKMEVELAENGKIAVDMFHSHPEGYYSAILMDMRMPVMNGLEASAAIRASESPDAKDIPIIALTANAFDEDVQRSLQVGLNAHLSKPVDPDKLFATLESLIRD